MIKGFQREYLIWRRLYHFWWLHYLRRQKGKVNPGSLSEQAGLMTGDAILKIMGQSTEHMRHKEAQDTILRAGNNIEMIVQRLVHNGISVSFFSIPTISSHSLYIYLSWWNFQSLIKYILKRSIEQKFYIYD
ncbi:UNVERIFIED_CONTAM: Zasp52 [Trichonephila clavipes]